MRAVRLSIRARILGAFALVLAVMGVVGVISFRGAVTMSDDADTVDRTNVVLRKLDLLQADVAEALAAERGVVLTGAATERDAFATALAAATSDLGAARAQIRSASALAGVDDIAGALTDFTQQMTSVVDTHRTQGQDAALALVRDGKTSLDEINRVTFVA